MFLLSKVKPRHDENKVMGYFRWHTNTNNKHDCRLSRTGVAACWLQQVDAEAGWL